MALFLYESFLSDLRDYGDANFANRVLKKVINPNGTFRSDSQDHRFTSIDDGWVRYVSAGKTALRVIFVRKGEDVYLYRAGPHSVEDNLTGPASSAIAVPVTAPDNISVKASPGGAQPSAPSPLVGNRFLQNGRRRLLKTFILGRQLMPHSEVMLISPYLSLPMLLPASRLGTAVDKLVEDGAKITLITRWAALNELDTYRELEARGVEILFHQTLHAKLYVFTVRKNEGAFPYDFKDVAVIGSANLTEKGFGFSESAYNEELCYELPDEAHEGAIEFACQLAAEAIDLARLRLELTRRR